MIKMLAPVFRSRRTTSFVRFVVFTALIFLAIYTWSSRSPQYFTQPLQGVPGSNPPGQTSHKLNTAKTGFGVPGIGGGVKAPHPIDQLLYDAQTDFNDLLAKESKTLAEAAHAYRKRRGRHPPPGFDKWYEFAKQNDAIVVEDFFDQVYHDIEPFWGIPTGVIRKEAYSFEMSIHIREGKAKSTSDWFWTLIWLDMIKSIEHLLPDMDMPLNAMDEPRLVVPWEDINKYMNKASQTRIFHKPADVVSEFQHLPKPGRHDRKVKIPFKRWEKTSRSHIRHTLNVWLTCG